MLGGPDGDEGAHEFREGGAGAEPVALDHRVDAGHMLIAILGVAEDLVDHFLL